MLCALRDADVDFLLVGSSHGFPRATLDIDLWVRPSPENAQRICRALTVFGAPVSQISATDFEKEDMMVQIGVAPRRIDFVASISGVVDDEAARNVVEREIDGTRVRILSAISSRLVAPKILPTPRSFRSALNKLAPAPA